MADMRQVAHAYPSGVLFQILNGLGMADVCPGILAFPSGGFNQTQSAMGWLRYVLTPSVTSMGPFTGPQMAWDS